MEAGGYTVKNMLIEKNPFGTNAQSLYVYFCTKDPVSVSYKVDAEDKKIGEFSANVWQEEEYQTEHEFQVVGLVPEMENKITFFYDERRWLDRQKRDCHRNGSGSGR